MQVIEYMIIAALLILTFWLVQRYLRIEAEVVELKNRFATAHSDVADLEQSVAQLIGELKTVADGACASAAAQIAQLKALQEKVERDAVVAARERSWRQLVPTALILELADRGRDAIQIARETGLGLGEVELFLRLHHRDDVRPKVLQIDPTSSRREQEKKEIAVA